MKITRGKIPCAKKCCIYGPEGIGKSTFASKFPDPVFIDTEGSTKDMDVARLPVPSSWTMLLEEVRYVISNPNICKTLIIDTADWAEQMCITAVCDKYQKTGIEEFGYGKGYTYVQEEFGKLLNLLSDVIEKGVNVVLTAHAKMRKFEQPDEMGAYDRWEMKLSKQVAPIVKEWADMVLFANYKTIVVNVDGQGAAKGKNKAQGGKRVMYTTHHNCWDAKNRYGLEDEVPFDFAAIAHIFQLNSSDTIKNTPSRPDVRAEPQKDVSVKSSEEPKKKEETKVSGNSENVTGQQMSMNLPKESPTALPEPDTAIPKELRDLMIANQVDEWDIQNVVAARGYFPSDMPVRDYPADFIAGVLIGAWDQVFSMIKDMKEQERIPFN